MPDAKTALMAYHLENASEKLKAADMLYRIGCYKDAIHRSYYAIFSAMRAVLALDGIDYAKHAGVISYFQKTYIKTGIFEKSIQSILVLPSKFETTAIMPISF